MSMTGSTFDASAEHSIMRNKIQMIRNDLTLTSDDKRYRIQSLMTPGCGNAIQEAHPQRKSNGPRCCMIDNAATSTGHNVSEKPQSTGSDFMLCGDCSPVPVVADQSPDYCSPVRSKSFERSDSDGQSPRGSVMDIVDEEAQEIPQNNRKHCPHYKKKSCSRFYFSCCGTIDPCHRCHVERGCCEVRPPQIASICCNVCDMRQAPSAACQNSACSNFNVPFSKSYCAICLVWTQVDITHCDKCGTCRVGTSEDLFHCDTCGVCFLSNHQTDHHPRCVKSSLKDQSCPLCLESVYLSLKRCVIVRCGHAAHYDCLQESMKHGDPNMPPRCPTCRKCLLTDERAEPFWDSLRYSIKSQPLPMDMTPPIRVGDEVLSPLGPFLVQGILDAEIRFTPAPAPASASIPVANAAQAPAMILASPSSASTITIASQEAPWRNGSGNGSRISSAHALYGMGARVASYLASGDQPVPSALSLPIRSTTTSRSTSPGTGAGAYTYTTNICQTIVVCTGVLTAHNNASATIPVGLLQKDYIVDIFCHDCERKSKASFHFLGLECPFCRGFNTARA